MIELQSLQPMIFSKTSIILCIDIIVICIIAVLIYKRMAKQRKAKQESVLLQKKNPPIVISSKDIRAIAGDDVMVTQLDLARAYIELGKKKLAKQILDHVIQHGNPQQQQSARQLMAGI